MSAEVRIVGGFILGTNDLRYLFLLTALCLIYFKLRLFRMSYNVWIVTCSVVKKMKVLPVAICRLGFFYLNLSLI